MLGLQRGNLTKKRPVFDGCLLHYTSYHEPREKVNEQLPFPYYAFVTNHLSLYCSVGGLVWHFSATLMNESRIFSIVLYNIVRAVQYNKTEKRYV